jgi:hypothetical protein
MSGKDNGTVRVQVTSMDGNLTHPFRVSQTVADVQQFAYERLVQDKSAIPLSATSIEAGGAGVAGSTKLGSLASGDEASGKGIDLSLALTWVSQGG